MNKKLKMFVIVCICLIVAGTCLAGIGLLLGATGNIELNHIFWNLGDNHASINVGTASTESQATLSGERITDSVEINQPVNVIKTKVGLGDIKMIESDQFKVVYTYDKGIGKPDINIADGILTIADKFSKEDVNIQVKKWSSLKNNKGLEYKIYYPKGTKVKLIEMDNNLGEIDIFGVETETLKLDLDVGDIKLTDVIANNADIDSSLGDIKTQNIQTGTLKLDLDAGDIDVEGSLKGENRFNTDMGDIKVQTTLEKDKYALKLNATLGDITVNGDEVEGTCQVNNNSENNIEAQTSAGDIKLKFQ
nr:DUF4097 family beta strand repeat-containing protein [uncultured Aminipila sp.]